MKWSKRWQVPEHRQGAGEGQAGQAPAGKERLRAGAVLRRWSGWAACLLVLALGMAVRSDQAAEARLRRDVTFLASDQCEGRGPGTRGLDLAADYLAEQFRQAGLKPGGVHGGWFQPFSIPGVGRLEFARLSLRGPLGQEIVLQEGKDFTVLGLSGSGRLTAPLVFAGFGVSAKTASYDDYAGIDVAGKVVLVLRRTPRYDNNAVPFDGSRRDQHASLQNKLANAETHRAAAVLLVNDRTDLERGDRLLPFNALAGSGSAGAIPFLHLHRDLAEGLVFSVVGKPLREVEAAISRDLTPHSTPLTGWTAQLEVRVRRPTEVVKNVIGIVEGSGPLAKEVLVIGAHYDHLGYGDPGSRLKDRTQRQIHHGADDNASGTAALLELARRFAQRKEQTGRRLVFIAFSGEERGLLGSRYWCNTQPLVPLEHTVAMLNLDMVGRLRPGKNGHDKLYVEGVGTARGFAELVEQVNRSFHFDLVRRAAGTGPSDHDSFYRKNIPVLFLWTGYHSDYHLPSDTADKINIVGMVRVVDFAEQLLLRLRTAPRPEYVRLAEEPPPPGGRNLPRLGILPSYEDNEQGRGLLIADVTAGGPAAQAGLKAGDRIIAIAGRPVTNLNTYMLLMSQQVRGQPVEVRVLRQGKEQTFRVVPQ
jgi:hypothetical protein